MIRELLVLYYQALIRDDEVTMDSSDSVCYFDASVKFSVENGEPNEADKLLPSALCDLVQASYYFSMIDHTSPPSLVPSSCATPIFNTSSVLPTTPTMEPSTSSEPPPESAILFRPSKKRKIYRQRPTSPSEDLDAPAPVPVPQTLEELITTTADESVEGVQVSMAEILRQRKQHRQRVGGVEFRAAPPASSREENPEMAVAVRGEEEKQEVEDTGGVRKFARQTGLVGDVDKHM
jgi:hypothetical protein